MNRTLAFSIALPALAALSVWVGPAAYADAPTHEIRKTEPKVAAGGHAQRQPDHRRQERLARQRRGADHRRR